VSTPTPSEDIINTFTQALADLGGQAGNKKLQDKLNMSDNDYLWVRDYLIHEGRLKPGRGRGGSVRLLTGAAAEQAKEQIRAKEEAASVSSIPMDDDFNLEAVKSKFRKLPEDVKAFEPGMHVVRPMVNMFNEEGAWKYMKHYTVTRVQEGYVFVQPRPSRKDQVELSAPPEGFYEAVR